MSYVKAWFLLKTNESCCELRSQRTRKHLLGGSHNRALPRPCSMQRIDPR